MSSRRLASAAVFAFALILAAICCVPAQAQCYGPSCPTFRPRVARFAPAAHEAVSCDVDSGEACESGRERRKIVKIAAAPLKAAAKLVRRGCK